jgi:methionine aminotransferase
LKIHSKLPNVGTTIFTVMSALATEHNAVNLGQGFPDYTMSDELISLVSQAMKKRIQSIRAYAGLHAFT